MKKILLLTTLSLAIAASALGDGHIPISGYAGCAPGLYYPDTGDCVYNLAEPVRTPKEDPILTETDLVTIILKIKDLIF